MRHWIPGYGCGFLSGRDCHCWTPSLTLPRQAASWEGTVLLRPRQCSTCGRQDACFALTSRSKSAVEATHSKRGPNEVCQGQARQGLSVILFGRADCAMKCAVLRHGLSTVILGPVEGRRWADLLRMTTRVLPKEPSTLRVWRDENESPLSLSLRERGLG